MLILTEQGWKQPGGSIVWPTKERTIVNVLDCPPHKPDDCAALYKKASPFIIVVIAR